MTFALVSAVVEGRVPTYAESGEPSSAGFSDNTARFLAGQSLSGLGFLFFYIGFLAGPRDVVTAQDGREACRLLQANAFDLLVTDIRLPGIDGVTLTRLARSSAQKLAVVWITAHGCAPVREDAARLGVYRCLEKPVEVSEFRRVAEQALAEGVPGST